MVWKGGLLGGVMREEGRLNSPLSREGVELFRVPLPSSVETLMFFGLVELVATTDAPPGGSGGLYNPVMMRTLRLMWPDFVNLAAFV
jgi:hypothetical protein